ncbi:hypothetical protein [Leptolyngbya sp. O-77]|uniref:hypothetical protein n=1 Tax=Leptolyngbya sp. O-77 TaxID=1080068 RepID=UPI000AFB7357|nr:hypothetical protein [Leptolyngbya sp. O-77]
MHKKAALASDEPFHADLQRDRPKILKDKIGLCQKAKTLDRPQPQEIAQRCTKGRSPFPDLPDILIPQNWAEKIVLKNMGR